MLAVVIIIKCLYFMKLVDKMAPFINMIWLIFYGIRTFMIVLFIAVFGFATAFCLIGQNQYWEVINDFEEPTNKQNRDALNDMTIEDKVKLNDNTGGSTFSYPSQQIPSYSDFFLAFEHVYFMALGDYDKHAYEIGENKLSRSILYIYFLIASFFLSWHLLSMLISIMAEIFAINFELQHKQICKSHL